jgi:SAM-dependent methyltransferase
MLQRLKWFIKIRVYNDNISNLISLVKNKKKHLPALETILDIGCNDGVYTKLYSTAFRIDFSHCYGLDYNESAIRKLPDSRFFLYDLDSLSPLPFKDEFFSLIIANQVAEHIKYIDYFFSEASRILRDGGALVVSVPNLAAWHSRLLLLLGRMPTAIQGIEHHVRGYTLSALTRFARNYGFRAIGVTGSGIYPLWGKFNRIIGMIFPSFSVFFTVLFVKSARCQRLFAEKKYHETKLAK